MQKTAEAFPLQWPSGWFRTPNRKKPQFKQTFGSARDELFMELKRLGAQYPVLSTNVPLKTDGMPYASFKPPTDPGAAIYFLYKGKKMTFACDRWDNVTDNVHSISLTVKAIRGIERWGASEMMERAFSGFTALPPPAEHKPKQHWKEVLCFKKDDSVTLERVKQLRNNLIKRYHPDNGTHPDSAAAAEVNQAYEEAEKDLSGI